MALFKKFISAVKKLFRGKSSSRRKKRKIPSRKRRTLRTRKVVKPKKIKKIKKIKPAPKPNPKTARTRSSAKTVPLPEKPSGVLTGEITHYFSKISVVVVKMTHGSFAVGNRIRIQGKGTDFVQKVNSLQIESQDVKVAPKGQLVGLKVVKPAKPGDKVFKLA
jgi:hypothetical protein